MIDAAKIEAALAATAATPSDDLVVSLHPDAVVPFYRDTGLTVAELREALQAARGQAWRDASDPPRDNRTVLVQDHDGEIYLGAWRHDAFIDCAASLYIAGVRRWRELTL